jgi:RND family efflux transporter MFP subunit
MAQRSLQQLLRHLRRVASPAGGLSDAELLGRFAENRDEAAFEAIVWRYGALVYGLCRRLIGHTQDAEDAFQATFLILARKASSLRRCGAVGPWLYRVAERVARRTRGRKRATAPLPDSLAGPVTANSAEAADLRRLLREEVMRLPARYRLPVVLRYLEGRSTDEAAMAIGCPPGTVLSRLAWARRRLKTRLAARGAALSVAVAAMAGNETAGAVPVGWVTAAAGSAATFAAGGRSGRPAILALEVLRAMLMTRLRVGAVVTIGVLATGACLLVPGVSPARVDAPEHPKQPSVELTAVRPTLRSPGQFEDYQGVTEAAAKVDIRSRVTGQIEKIAFQPGARVKRGDLLFELDSRAIGIELLRARAQETVADNRLRRARAAYERAQALKRAAATGEDALSEARGAAEEAETEIMVAKANLARVQLDLEATRITSPIDGQTGGTVYGVGNLASPNTTLVTVISADPIYVEFLVAENSIARVRKLFQDGNLSVRVKLPGDAGFDHDLSIVFVDNRVDPPNRTVKLRGVLPNRDGRILPGMSVQVRLMSGTLKEQLRLPKSAVRFADGNVTYVLLPGRGDSIEWRRVEVSHSQPNEEELIIISGISADDRVIVDRILPGSGVPIRIREAAPER